MKMMRMSAHCCLFLPPVIFVGQNLIKPYLLGNSWYVPVTVKARNVPKPRNGLFSTVFPSFNTPENSSTYSHQMSTLMSHIHYLNTQQAIHTMGYSVVSFLTSIQMSLSTCQNCGIRTDDRRYFASFRPGFWILRASNKRVTNEQSGSLSDESESSKACDKKRTFMFRSGSSKIRIVNHTGMYNYILRTKDQ